MKKNSLDINLNFFDIAYSLGGRSNVDKLYKVLHSIHTDVTEKGVLSDRDLLSPQELEVLKCVVETYERDKMFPSWTFLQETYGIVSNAPVRNLGDFNTAINLLLSTRKSLYLKNAVSIHTSNEDDLDEYLNKLQQEVGRFKSGSGKNTLQTFVSVKDSYMFLKNAPQGITCGIEAVDLLTAGFQAGTVATVAGFTSHGKSTIANNLAYLNASLGRKVGVVSMEIVAALCKYIYLSRHSYTMGRPVEYSTLIRSHLGKEEERYLFEVVEPDFLEKVGKNLIIAETADIPSYSMRGFEQLYSMMEETLGGLDVVIWDHVNQFKYVNPGSAMTGDHYIKMLTDLSKSYVTRAGTHPVTVFVVQINREGYKRAARNGGEYDLTALSDFNEIEKSSTYVLFTYADESMRSSEQALVQLKKHRLGQVMLSPQSTEVAYKYSAVGTSFSNVIASMSPDREADLADMFVSAFSNTDEFNLVDRVFNQQAPVVQVSGGVVEQEQGGDDGEYRRNIVSGITSDDFTI